MRLLVVANKALADSDYRRAYAAIGRAASDVLFGTPERPATVEPGRYVRFGFGEGVSVSDVAELISLYRYLRRERSQLDLVHFYSTKLVLLGPIVASMARVPSLVTVTGFGRVWSSEAVHHRALRPLYLLLMYIAAQRAEVVLFQNRGDQRFLATKLPGCARAFRYVGSGVDAVAFQRRTYESTSLVVTNVARLLPSKGIEDYLSIAGALAGGPFEFRLIGPPSKGQEETLHAVRVAHERGIVRYLGELSPRDTEQQLRDAHVLLFTSYGEGMSRVMLEAGFAGACPVAFDIPANRDLVADGRGFLVRRSDTRSAVEILRRLADDRALLAQNAVAYQAYVLKEFSAASFATRLDEILTDVMARARREVQHEG